MHPVDILERYIPSPRPIGLLKVPSGSVRIYPWEHGPKSSRKDTSLLVRTTSDGSYGVFISSDGLCIAQRGVFPGKREVYSVGTDTASFWVQDDGPIQLRHSGTLYAYEMNYMVTGFSMDQNNHYVGTDFCLLYSPIKTVNGDDVPAETTAIAVVPIYGYEYTTLFKIGNYRTGFGWYAEDGTPASPTNMKAPFESDRWIEDAFSGLDLHILSLG